MLKFFRNIRRRLLRENRFTRYLIYALGEIFLVVIGILIALQINNWNDDQKAISQEAIYLQDLKRDLETDIITLDERIEGNNLRLQNIDSIIYYIRSKESVSEIERQRFISFHEILTSESYFLPETSTINQIESASSGKLIRNKDLRDLIFRYYSNSERLEKNSEVSLQLYQHHIITENIAKPVIIKKEAFALIFGDPLGLDSLNIANLAGNEDYLMALVAKRQGTLGQNTEYKKLKGSATKVLNLIEQEL